MMQAGKYIFLDIGRGETKIAEAIVKQRSITVLKTAEMRDMSLFVSDTGVIRQIEGFCSSLKKTVDEADIKTTNVILCSSIFKIDIRDITEEFKSVKACIAGFDKMYGRAADYAVIHDWQPLGEVVTAKEIKQKLYLTSGPIDILKSFMNTLRNITGLTVVGIESSFTALSNLQFLYPATYDLPSVALVDVARDTTHIQVYKNGAIVHDGDMASSLNSIPQTLASMFDIALPKMKNIIYNIGLIDNDKNQAQLAAASISPEKYYTAIQECCAQFVAGLQKFFLNLLSKKIESVQVVFTGGYLDVPGMSEYIQKIYTFTPSTVFKFDSAFNTKVLKIINKTNHTISAKFAGCIGLMMKNQNTQHTVNLVPKELLVVDSGKIISNSLAGVCVALGIVGAVIIGVNVPNVIEFVGLLQNREQTDTVIAEYAAAEAECNKLENYVSNLKNINSTLTPFVSFLQTCESKDLRIATVDTANILDVVVTKVTDSEGASEAATSASSASTDPLDHIVIRGYASNSAAITDFYSKLSDNSSVVSVNMNGISEVNLNTGTGDPDYISLFEMEVQVNG